MWGMLGIEGGITVEMNEPELRSMISRLRRLAGQARSLETVLFSKDNSKFVTQLEAVIAAGRATLSHYAKIKLINSNDPDDQKILGRIIRKG